MFAAILVSLISISFCNCGIFELSDFGHQFPNIWNNRHSHSTQAKCKAKLEDGTTIEGVCKTKAECSRSGGVPRGRCGILSTCCTYERSCGKTVDSKVSYFTSGNIALQNSGVCPYHVVLMNDNVCQIRLDFIDFHTASAQLKSGTPFICVLDDFYTNPRNHIPSICGYNTGQHLYMHLPRSSRNISLNMKITGRTTNLPRWNIKVTQLECPKNEIRTSTELAHVDAELIAPLGCLQYYSEPFGNLKSFGFDATSLENVYVANQHYSICFKRFDDTCGIAYNFKYFKLVAQGSSNILCTDDYLFIPGLVTSTLVAKICGLLPNDLRVLGNSPGPLHVDFHTDEYLYTLEEMTGGFNIDYELQMC